jgi:hypothetical protein
VWNKLSEDTFVSNVIPALIGAISGSVGGNFLSDWLSRRSEKHKHRRELVDKYLIQLQDNLESLWFRVNNIKNRDGLQKMSDRYYEESTLYILGSVLAYNRILSNEGAYTKIEQSIPGLGNFLREKLNQFGSYLDNIEPDVHFYLYDRIALAEAVMSLSVERFSITSYLEFRKQYEDSTSNLNSLIGPARTFVTRMKSLELKPLMQKIYEIADKIESQTGITTGIKNPTF